MAFEGVGKEVFLNSTEKKCPQCNGWGTEPHGYRKENGDWQHMSLTCSLCNGKKTVPTKSSIT